MEPNTQNETPQNKPETAQTPPRGRMLFFVLLLVIMVIGMYAGTFYKITQYGA